MKFTCEKTALVAAINTASRAAAVKSAVPSLEGILIEAEDGVTVTGFDLKTGIRSSIQADVTEPGDVVINAKIFGDIIRKLPDDVVSMTVNESTFACEIKCGMSEFSIMGMTAQDYPDLPTVDFQNSLELKERVLRDIISRTSFAISDNEARPIHTGALFELDKEFVTVVAVDGYRLALRKEKAESIDVADSSFVVPGLALNEAERICGDSDDIARITVGTKHIMFTIGSNQLISRRLEGDFLNYRNAVPQNAKYSLICDRRSLIESVERVSLIISDKFKSPVRCTFRDGEAEFITSSTLGRAQDRCSIEGDGDNLEIGFNNRYLLEALRAAPTDKVCIKLSTSVAPCVIVPTDNSRSFLYMILPVRMRSSEA